MAALQHRGAAEAMLQRFTLHASLNCAQLVGATAAVSATAGVGMMMTHKEASPANTSRSFLS
jgi:hypothetical protein